MNTSISIKLSIFILLSFALNGCLSNSMLASLPSDPDIPDRVDTNPQYTQGFEKNIYLVDAIVSPSGVNRRTPIEITLDVPNSCFKIMGGSIYGQGKRIVADLAVFEKFHLGSNSCGPNYRTYLRKVIYYPFPLHRGRAFNLRVKVNGVNIADYQGYGLGQSPQITPIK